jgi:hypothetical protein
MENKKPSNSKISHQNKGPKIGTGDREDGEFLRYDNIQ